LEWVSAAPREARPSALHALIVDHGLRPGSGGEAHRVARDATKHGFSAHVLVWKGTKPRASIEDAAREARYRLMGAWCARNKIAHLLVAHTMDDVAETFLIRLGRGSGVDGLSAIRARTRLPVEGFDGVTLHRPLLGFTRAELRRFLQARGAHWIEDPMNDDPRFTRTRMRALLPLLAEAGVPLHRISDAAHHLARGREALEAATAEFLSRHARQGAGAALLDGDALLAAPREIGLRVLSTLLRSVAGVQYPPRFDGLEGLYAALEERPFAARTLAGCRIGMAPRAAQAFGRETVEIKLAPQRKSRKSGRKPAGPG
jgi:tRNA(Ile)-lysidine synthase